MKKGLFCIVPLLLSSLASAQESQTPSRPLDIVDRCVILRSVDSFTPCPDPTFPRPIPPRPGPILPKPVPVPPPCLTFMRCIPFPVFN
jgi:hypothetical protein